MILGKIKCGYCGAYPCAKDNFIKKILLRKYKKQLTVFYLYYINNDFRHKALNTIPI